MRKIWWNHHRPHVVRLQGVQLFSNSSQQLFSVVNFDCLPIVFCVLHHDRIYHILLFSRTFSRRFFSSLLTDFDLVPYRSLVRPDQSTFTSLSDQYIGTWWYLNKRLNIMSDPPDGRPSPSRTWAVRSALPSVLRCSVYVALPQPPCSLGCKPFTPSSHHFCE